MEYFVKQVNDVFYIYCGYLHHDDVRSFVCGLLKGYLNCLLDIDKISYAVWDKLGNKVNTIKMYNQTL